MASVSEFHQLRDEAFKKLSPDDYTKLKSDPDLLKKAEAAMKQTYDELKYMMGHTTSLDDALGHLSPERQKLIKTSLRLQSFQVDIQDHTDGSAGLLCSSLAGQPLSFVQPVVKLSAENQAETRILLVARIVLEVIILFLNILGIHAIATGRKLDEAIEIIIQILSAHEKIFDDVNDMVEAQKGRDNEGVAYAIVACIVDLFSIVGTAAMDVVKIVLKDMPWYDIIITVVQVSLFVTTVVASGRLVLFAKVVSFLLDASSFVRKLVQMSVYNSLEMSK